jgi:protein-tyrosine phosphatase
MVAASLLLARNHVLTADEAIQLVKSIRPGIRLNKAQRQAVADSAEQVHAQRLSNVNNLLDLGHCP